MFLMFYFSVRPFLTEIVMAGAEEGSSVGAVKEGDEVTLLCRYFFKLNLKMYCSIKKQALTEC